MNTNLQMSKVRAKKDENFERLPPIGDLFRDLMTKHDTDGDQDRTRTEPNTGFNQTTSGWTPSGELLTLANSQLKGAGGSTSLNVSQISAQPGSDGPISFTILPTEEDFKQMQSFQDETGYIKRPMNAFMVFSRVYRNALQKAGRKTTATTAQVGCEWSKLSKEQKRPYYDFALRLAKLHKQQFPDYEYCPNRSRRELTSVQGAGEPSEHQQNSSVPVFSSQVLPLIQPIFLPPSMYPHPTQILYPWDNYPYSSFYPYRPMPYRPIPYRPVPFYVMDQSYYPSSCIPGVSHYQEADNSFPQQSGVPNLTAVSTETVQQMQLSTTSTIPSVLPH